MFATIINKTRHQLSQVIYLNTTWNHGWSHAAKATTSAYYFMMLLSTAWLNHAYSFLDLLKLIVYLIIHVSACKMGPKILIGFDKNIRIKK